GTIYYWDQSTAEVGDNLVSDYKQYNLTGGGTNTATGKIGVGQGFFIRTTSAGTMTFKTTHQIVGNNNQFFKGKSKTKSDKKKGRSWFLLRRGNEINSILVGFLKGATFEFDNLYDGPFDVTNTKLGFYSLIGNQKKATIQGLPELTTIEEVISLGFVVDEIGTYTIEISEEHIDAEYYIFLKDTKENKVIDLRKEAHVFTVSSVGENNTRFKVHYTKDPQTLNMDDQVIPERKLIAYVNGNKELVVQLKNTLEKIKSIKIVNILGKEVDTYVVKDPRNISKLKSGIYIVVVELDSSRRMSKKIIIIHE
ncbi:MAG: T9SS type A sorting domain-containing protein, partial [Flavobacteriaceae bacterium]|nr:T9SS type A sorting domain-containing protein [Flavobacteriaceae bacterium]